MSPVINVSSEKDVLSSEKQNVINDIYAHRLFHLIINNNYNDFKKRPVRLTL